MKSLSKVRQFRDCRLIPALLLVLSLSGGLLFMWPVKAAPVICNAFDSKGGTPQLPGCIPVLGKPNTWVIPAQWPETPGENEPNGEQTMVLDFGDGSIIKINGKSI